MDKQQKERLEWFFHFVSLDLDNISTSERYAAIGYISDLVFRIERNPYKANMAAVGKEATRFNGLGDIEQALEGSQKRLKELIGEIADAREYIQKLQDGKWHSGEKYPAFDLPQFETKVIFKPRMLDFFKFVEVPEKPVNQEEDAQFRLKQGTTENLLISISSEAENIEETLLIHFIQSLEGAPLGAIRKCPECGNFFLHLSKRVRVYCSNKCAVKGINVKRYHEMKEAGGEEYKAELEKGRKRARKSYNKQKKGG